MRKLKLQVQTSIDGFKPTNKAILTWHGIIFLLTPILDSYREPIQ